MRNKLVTLIIALVVSTTMASASEGALPGEFSVSATLKVHFSKGNLQYQASTKTWRFAVNQYDIIGSNNTKISSTYSGWIDLFGWGTSGYSQQPYATSGDYHRYPCNTSSGCLQTNIAGTNHDWGRYNKISNGGNVTQRWRTLTYDEWKYLLNTRSNAASKKGYGKVDGVIGLILLPDSWTLPSGSHFTAGELSSTAISANTYTAVQWKKLEDAGAVFLPQAGRRSGDPSTTINGYSSSTGDYWTGTVCSADQYPSNYWLYAGHMTFANQGTTSSPSYKAIMLYTTTGYAIYTIRRYHGASVRLAQNSSVYNTNTNTISTIAANGTVTGGGVYDLNASVVLTATPNSCYRFKQWSDGNTSNPRTITVTGNATYTAQFEKIQYTITFKNDNGTTLQSGKVNCGVTPSYTGTTPTKSSTAQYTYTFSGWAPTITAASADKTYTATYTQTVRKYNITFVNAEGVQIGSVQQVEYGQNATPPTPPVREGYTFAGWIGLWQNVKADATIYPSYYKNSHASTAQPGTLDGIFSVSPTEKVRFSQGNLQYNAAVGIHQCADATIQQGTWRFADNQWDYVGDDANGTVYADGVPCDNSLISSTYSGWIDLLGWGTSGWSGGSTAYQPWSTNQNCIDYWIDGDYTNDLVGVFANADWGVYNAIINGGNEPGVWRSLTQQEMIYLLRTRPNASNLYGKAVVNGVRGAMILPDAWTTPTGVSFTPTPNNWTTNVYSLEQWQILENNGAVFLPSGGKKDRRKPSVSFENTAYWSSSHFDKAPWTPASVTFSLAGGIKILEDCEIAVTSIEGHDGIDISCGHLIRLVHAIPVYTITTVATNGTTTGDGKYGQNAKVTLTATPNECYQFTQWSDGNTDNPRIIIVTGDATYIAEFTKIKYTIKTVSDDPAQGSTSVAK